MFTVIYYREEITKEYVEFLQTYDVPCLPVTQGMSVSIPKGESYEFYVVESVTFSPEAYEYHVFLQLESKLESED